VALRRAGRDRFRRAHEVYVAALEKHLGRNLSAAAAAELTDALEALAARRADG
jgi:hypothetical protein